MAYASQMASSREIRAVPDFAGGLLRSVRESFVECMPQLPRMRWRPLRWFNGVWPNYGAKSRRLKLWPDFNVESASVFGFGQRLSHSTASSIDLTSHIQ